MRVGYRIDVVVSLNLWEATDTDHRGAISTAPQEFEQRLIQWFDDHSSQTWANRSSLVDGVIKVVNPRLHAQPCDPHSSSSALLPNSSKKEKTSGGGRSPFPYRRDPVTPEKKAARVCVDPPSR